MSQVFVDWNEEQRVATLVLNRPEAMNALNVPMAQAVATCVAEIATLAPRAVVLRGEGRAFVAGGDVKSFATNFATSSVVIDELLDPLHAAVVTLAELPAPTIASVQGVVAGAGLSLMAGCDLVVAATGTRFMMAYDRIGAQMDCGGSWYLPRRIGRAKATKMMLLSEEWDAETSLQNGLVDQVCAAEELAEVTANLASKVSTGPTAAYAAWRKLVDASETHALANHLELERLQFRQATRNDDFVEGVTAFLEKRPAQFRGH